MAVMIILGSGLGTKAINPGVWGRAPVSWFIGDSRGSHGGQYDEASWSRDQTHLSGFGWVNTIRSGTVRS